MAKKKSKIKKAEKPKRVILKRGYFQEFYQEMLKVAPLVLQILRKKPKTRDNDSLLELEVWKAQGMKMPWSFKKFYYGFAMGKYSPAETIRRSRQKIQASPKHKDLQGTIYKQRQNADARFRNQLSLW